jgi:hypothetical protein
MKTVVLLSPKEMDEAAAKVPGYKAPGA